MKTFWRKGPVRKATTQHKTLKEGNFFIFGIEKENENFCKLKHINKIIQDTLSLAAAAAALSSPFLPISPDAAPLNIDIKSVNLFARTQTAISPFLMFSHAIDDIIKRVRRRRISMQTATHSNHHQEFIFIPDFRKKKDNNTHKRQWNHPLKAYKNALKILIDDEVIKK